jgi:hypothetical protein
MDGDAIGTAKLCENSSPHRIRFVCPPGLTDCGHMVDIDEQAHSASISRAHALCE